jgi:phage recombination protein Bet
MAARFQVEPTKLLETLKQTVFKGATDAQLVALVVVANEWGLNPFVREIYAFPDSKGGGIVPVVSIDGWLNRINSHSQYDGMEKEFADGHDGKPVTCTVTIFRKDRSKPTRHTEIFSECFRNTDPWKNQPHRMLGHRTLIQCARIAFGFAGADPEDAGWASAPARARVVEPLPFLPPDSPLPAEAPTQHAQAAPPAATSGAAETPALEPAPETPAFAKAPTPRRRPAPKPVAAPAPVENHNALTRLARLIKDHDLDLQKCDDWCVEQVGVRLDSITEEDAEQILNHFPLLKEATL